MSAKAVKLVSIAALLLSFLWCFLAGDQVWSVQVGGYLEALVLVVWASALMVAPQTVLAHKSFGQRDSLRLLCFSTLLPLFGCLGPRFSSWIRIASPGFCSGGSRARTIRKRDQEGYSPLELRRS